MNNAANLNDYVVKTIISYLIDNELKCNKCNIIVNTDDVKCKNCVIDEFKCNVCKIYDLKCNVCKINKRICGLHSADWDSCYYCGNRVCENCRKIYREGHHLQSIVCKLCDTGKPPPSPLRELFTSIIGK